MIKKLMMLCFAAMAMMGMRAVTETVNGITWTYSVADDKATIGSGYLNTAVPTSTSGAITIPATLGGYPVTSIGDYAFRNCRSLTSVTIPDSVTSIDDDAFSGCSSLTNVTIGNSVTDIGHFVFDGCSSLMSINVSVDNSCYSSKNGLLLSKDGKTLVHGVNGVVAIPDSVTSIDDDAFSGCSSLTNVTIGNSVTSIGLFAFYDCSSLMSINVSVDNSCYSSKNGLLLSKDGKTLVHGVNGVVAIPDSVTSIGSCAFRGCSSLTSVTIPDSVTSIGEYAFYYDCSSLTNVTIGNSVTDIGYRAFSGCSSLASVTIPDGVTSIGSEAFDGCSSLTNVTIGNSVTDIGYRAFYNCRSLTIVTIPDSVTSIGDSAFSACNTALYDTTTIPGVTSVDGWAIDSNNSLSGNLDLTGVKGIGYGAFDGCSSLTSVTIPDSVTSIGSGAFEGCSSLTNVTIGNSVTSVGSDAFEGCSSLTNVTIGNSVTDIGYRAFYDCRSLTSVTIPDSVMSIGSCAFEDCSSLTSVTIPGSVTSIGDRAFSGCNTALYDATTIPGVTLVDGWAIDSNDSLSGNLDLTGVKGIGYGAFYNCSFLTSVTIGDSVTSIGEYAFRGCSSLMSVTIPDSVASIGDRAFYGCSSLTSVTIPDSVTDIGDDVFSGCSSLTSITIPGSVTSIRNSAFEGYSSLTNVVIHDGVTHIGEDAFSDCSSLTSVIMPNSVTNIGDSIFDGCVSLERVTIPNKLTSIARETFAWCRSLKSVIIPDSVTSIEIDAFYGCSSLTSVTIPSSVMSIGRTAFEDCSSLTNIIFEGNAPAVGYRAFDNVGLTCTIFVTRTSTGWDVTIPGKWNGLNIQYIDSMPTPTPDPDPEPTPTPTPEPQPEPEPTPEIGEGGYGIGVIDGQIPENAASVYDGYLYRGNEVAGTIQAKGAKPKNGVAKVTTTIQITGEKKVSVKGELDVESGKLEAVAKDGRELYLEFGSEGLIGEFDGYEIDGVRNFFSSKDKQEKKAADEMLALWLGALNMITDRGTLSVTVAKKGKVTVKGTVDGAKVSAKAQALIGEDFICIPVIYSKKTTNLAFTIWLPLNGGEAKVIGLDGSQIGKAGVLKDGAKFSIDDNILSDIDGIVTYNGEPILPDGESVAASGNKWLVADGAKAAKVAYKKGVLSITPGKKGGEIANVSGLKLSYKAKDGSFTGSFTVYALENGKLKKHKASVSGVLVNGVGRGTATIKKLGIWTVEIR